MASRKKGVSGERLETDGSNSTIFISSMSHYIESISKEVRQDAQRVRRSAICIESPAPAKTLRLDFG